MPASPLSGARLRPGAATGAGLDRVRLPGYCAQPGSAELRGIAGTVYGTHGHGECPLSARLRTPAGEAAVSAKGRNRRVARVTAGVGKARLPVVGPRRLGVRFWPNGVTQSAACECLHCVLCGRRPPQVTRSALNSAVSDPSTRFAVARTRSHERLFTSLSGHRAQHGECQFWVVTTHSGSEPRVSGISALPHIVPVAAFTQGS
jgi:hypothetical protein